MLHLSAPSPDISGMRWMDTSSKQPGAGLGVELYRFIDFNVVKPTPCRKGTWIKLQPSVLEK